MGEALIVRKGSLPLDTSDATATAGAILSGRTAYVNGEKITGTMTNRGAVDVTIEAGASYTVPSGYHNGSGKVTAATAELQTKTGTINATSASSTYTVTTGFKPAFILIYGPTGSMSVGGENLIYLLNGTTYSYTWYDGTLNEKSSSSTIKLTDTGFTIRGTWKKMTYVAIG